MIPPRCGKRPPPSWAAPAKLRVTGSLATCLKDPEPSVRRAAAVGLRAFGWRPSTREEAAWFDIALGNTPVALSVPLQAESSPEEKNEDTAFHRRMRAETLREKNDPTRVSALLTAARSNDLLARISAIHDLGQTSSPIVSEELVKFLRHPEPEVRLAASQALAVRDDTLPAHFLGLLEDSSFEVRLVAVRFFARVPNQQITQILLPLLSDLSLKSGWLRRPRLESSATSQPSRTWWWRSPTKIAMCVTPHTSLSSRLIRTGCFQTERRPPGLVLKLCSPAAALIGSRKNRPAPRQHRPPRIPSLPMAPSPEPQGFP